MGTQNTIILIIIAAIVIVGAYYYMGRQDAEPTIPATTAPAPAKTN